MTNHIITGIPHLNIIVYRAIMLSDLNGDGLGRGPARLYRGRPRFDRWRAPFRSATYLPPSDRDYMSGLRYDSLW
jgi:hypothetical protein